MSKSTSTFNPELECQIHVPGDVLSSKAWKEVDMPGSDTHRVIKVILSEVTVMRDRKVCVADWSDDLGAMVRPLRGLDGRHWPEVNGIIFA